MNALLVQTEDVEGVFVVHLITLSYGMTVGSWRIVNNGCTYSSSDNCSSGYWSQCVCGIYYDFDRPILRWRN